MTFEEYFEIEKTINGLDDIRIGNVPLWRIVRLHFRWKYINHNPITVDKAYTFIDLVINNIKSACGLAKLSVSGYKCDYVFLPHPRLYWVGDRFMERLTDPLIDYSGIGDNYVILERHQNGIHKKPRYHSKKVFYLDFVDSMTAILTPLYRKFVIKQFRDKVNELFLRLNVKYDIDESYRNMFYEDLTSYIIRKKLMSGILDRLSPKKVFLAPRATFLHVIDYCKEHFVTAVEIQHGITVGETDLYSGSYCPEADPDYFFVFGKANISPYFYIPLDKQINMGFPYKNYVVKNINKYGPNTSLVISEPEISSVIVNIICDLADRYPGYVFHIRCHPQEKLQETEILQIKQHPNVKVVDNVLESFCALSQYDTIIGENSSVLYEALSLHKRVLRLNYGGLSVIEDSNVHGGMKLNNPDDFLYYINQEYDDSYDYAELYSDFNTKVMNLI